MSFKDWEGGRPLELSWAARVDVKDVQYAKLIDVLDEAGSGATKVMMTAMPAVLYHTYVGYAFAKPGCVCVCAMRVCARARTRAHVYWVLCEVCGVCNAYWMDVCVVSVHSA